MKIKAPTPRDLNVFGYGLSLILAVMGEYQVLYQGHPTASIVLTILGIFFAVITVRHLALLKTIYRGWMHGAWVINWIVMRATLTLFYYFFFCPIAFLMRACDKDPLDKRFQTEDNSHWLLKTEQPREKERYLKQF